MTHTETYKVRGMHCASCASIIEKALGKIEGVDHIEVNVGTEAAKIVFDETKTSLEHLSKKIEPLGYSFVVSTAESMGMSENEHAEHVGLNQSKSEKHREISDMRTKVFSAIPLALFSAFVMGWDLLSTFGVLPVVPYIWKEFISLVFIASSVTESQIWIPL
ncbi:MAG: cation transporter [Candidatus Kaiserbacteria bacterium]|nr:cation transporter [Candidatus Kaiserbacteria bacterium]